MPRADRDVGTIGGLLAAVLVYALLVFAGGRLLGDPDTFWHIATGRWMFEHHAVPGVDIFSHTMAGRAWVAHEWLAEVLLAAAWRAFGWAGVVSLTAAGAAAAFGLLMRALTRALAVPAAAIVTALSFLLTAPHLTARPHVLAMPLLVAWVASLCRARAESRAPSLWLALVMAVWANLHGGFVIGIGIAGLVALDAVFAAPATARRAAVVSWGIFVAVAAAASLATPHGITGWLFPFHLTDMSFALGFVTEWQRPDLSRLQPVELWLGGFVLFILANRVRLSAVQWLTVAIFAAMALTRTRHAELLGLVVPLVIADNVRVSAGAPAKVAARPRRYALLAAAVVAAGSTRATMYAGAPEDNGAIAPRAAIEEVERRGIAGPVFNDYDFGGYLIFRGIPVFVDGRVDLYGDAFMREYARALGGDAEALAALLARHHVTWTLLEPSSPAASVLDHLPGWRLIYADPATKVHALAP